MLSHTKTALIRTHLSLPVTFFSSTTLKLFYDYSVAMTFSDDDDDDDGEFKPLLKLNPSYFRFLMAYV